MTGPRSVRPLVHCFEARYGRRQDTISGDQAIFSNRVNMPLGSELQLSTSSSAAASPKVSSAFGNLAVVWQGEGDTGGGGTDTEVFGRLLDSDGTPRNIEFQVTQRGDNAEDSLPAVAFAPSSEDTAVDEFVVVRGWRCWHCC